MTKAIQQKLKWNAALMLSFNSASALIQKSVIANAKKDLIMTIMECAEAIINGTIPLSTAQYNRLQGSGKDIASLVRKSLIDDEKVVLQKGGFLASLLGPIISTVVPGILKTVLGGGGRGMSPQEGGGIG